MDIAGFFSNGLQDVEKQLTDVVNTGWPAIQSAVEQSAINWLTDQKKETDKTLNANVQQMLKEPTQPGSFADNLKQALQAPVLSNYGPQILIGIGIIGIVGFLLLRK